MKTSALHGAVMACAILSNSLFPSEPCLAQGCPAPSFGSAGIFAAGVNSRLVAVGDFNRDGKLDLAVANYGDNPADVSPTRGSVSVLLGNGDGTFQAAVAYSFAGTNVSSVVVGDFNGDGKLDLAVGHQGSRDAGLTDAGVSLLLGNGDGTFQRGVNSSAPGAAYSIVIADFNGDGKPDLAMANMGTSPGGFTDTGVTVLLGNGDGTFQLPVNYSAGSKPFTLAVGDFNGDGRPDLVVANEGMRPDFSDGGIIVLLGNGDGTFQSAVSYSAGSRPRSVAVGDFNGDAKLDLAVADFGFSWNNWSDTGMLVLLGNGDGAFQAAANFNGGGATDAPLVVGDFNGDSKPDLVVVKNRNSVAVLLGNGDATFQTPVEFSVGTNSNALSVTVGDFNGDGKPDLVLANQFTAGYVSVLLNTCVSAGPGLAIARSNSTVTISWPFPSSGFVLESTTSLSPQNWQPAMEVPMTNNGRLEVSVPVNQGERYFRLHKP